jgi:ABC-type Fe3+/spermidine/putrescine transport system ATPase subunit
VDGGPVIEGITHDRRVGRTGTMSLRTVHLKLSADRPPVGTNFWPVTVLRSVFLGDITQVHVNWGQRELIARQTGPCPVADGQTAFLAIDPKHCVLLDS